MVGVKRHVVVKSAHASHSPISFAASFNDLSTFVPTASICAKRVARVDAADDEVD